MIELTKKEKAFSRELLSQAIELEFDTALKQAVEVFRRMEKQEVNRKIGVS